MARHNPPREEISLSTYVIRAIINPMKEAEARRLNRTLIKLNQRNKEIRHQKHDGFIFDGEYYMPMIPGRTLPTPQERASIDKSLWQEMEEYVQDREKTKTDIQMVQQAIFLVISGLKTWQDMRDALPDFFSEICPEIRSLSRTRPEAFTLAGNARHMQQFENMKERMAIYLVSRLMY